MAWYYDKAGTRTGPLDLAALIALIADGGIGRDTLVWTTGMPGWAAAAQCGELAEHFHSLPPPFPPSLRAATSGPRPPPLPESLPRVFASAVAPAAAPAADTIYAPIDRAQRRAEVSDYRVAPPEARLSMAPAPIMVQAPLSHIPAGAPPAHSLPADSVLAGPWRRFFARLFDSLVLGVVYFAVSAYVQEFAFYHPETEPLEIGDFWPLTTPLGVALLNAIVIALFGNTMGKALFGIRARPLQQPRFNFGQALWRELRVWFFGMGATIPLIGIIPLCVQFARVAKGRPAGYDRGRNEVISTSLNPIRSIIGGLLLLAILGTLTWGTAFLVSDLSRRMAAAGPGELVLPPPPGYSSSSNAGRFTAWTNPATSLSVALPAGWRYRGTVNADDGVGYGFDNAGLHLQIDLVPEQSAADLDGWLADFRDRMAATVVLSTWSKAPGHPDVWVAPASPRSDDSAATYYVTQVGDTVWRIVYTDKVDRNIRVISDPAMTTALLNSIGVRP